MPILGVFGQKWFDILSQRLIERKEENKVKVRLLTSNYSSPFYDDMKNHFRQLKQLGINMVVGESSVALAQTASFMRIPYISVDPYLCLSNAPEYSNMPHFYSLPVPEKLYSFAIFDLLNKSQVNKVAVIIDSSVDYDNFMRPLFEQKSINILLWTLDDKISSDIWKRQKKFDSILEESRIANVWDFVVKARTDVVKSIILRAKFYGMLVHPNKWYILSFLCYDINIAAIRQIYSNITLINEQCSESMLSKNSNYSDIAIINKAIHIFRMVNWKLTPENLNRALRLTGLQLFDNSGLQTRSQFSIHSINVDEAERENLRFIGVWLYDGHKTSLDYFYQKPHTSPLHQKMTYHLRVSAVEEHPHLIVLENNSVVGFGVDLLNELSKLMNFTYTIHLTKTVGSKEHFNWTGIVGEILTDKADISLGPLVHTKEIEEVLDFSTSFKQREISLVMKKSLPSTTLFQFFSPFSTNVWICCIAALVVLSLTMWLVEHVHDRYFLNEEELKLDLKESSWVAIACLLKQQMDIFPSSIPGRIVHWLLIFFSLIIITSYTANLAAFLTIKVYSNPIKSVEDLANLPENSEIFFGTVKESPILEFFEQSEMKLFRKIYKLMKKNPHWLVNDTRNGYRRALAEPFVFIWDDSVNQYEIFSESEYNCNLISVGRPFGKRSFSIGMKYDSPVLKKINMNMLEIIESGKTENLEKKWWKSKSICSPADNQVEGQEPLSINDVAGVFLIVVLGTVVSITWLVIQIVVHKCKERRPKRIHINRLRNELVNHESTLEPLTNKKNGFS